MEHIDRRIEGNFSQGWGMALFITALVLGAFVAAGTIHKRTYSHPRDVTAPYRKGPHEKGGALPA
jgi:hypothetical protein